MPPATISNLIDALHEGALTVLPTATAARSLRHAYDAAQRTRNLTAWEPAPILSWSQLLDRLWSEAILTGIETRLLLNPAQEHTLWLDIISGQQTESTLTSTDALADLAQTAWTLANAYNATSLLRAFATTHDARTFAAWAEAFQRLCDRNAYHSRAALQPALQLHIEAHALTPLPTLTLAGFPDLTPAQRNLLEAFRAAGSQITELTLEPSQSPHATRAILTAASEQEELQAVAQWLRTFIQQRPSQTTTVAVLLPDSSEAPALESVVRAILAPELQPISEDLSSTPWEFTSNSPLVSLPILATALDLAHWAQSPLELNAVTALLLSPYLTAPTELDTAAHFDANILRQANLLRPEIDLRSLLSMAANSITPISWIKSLIQYITKSGNLETPRTYADWAEFLRNLLAAANWPGQRPLSPHEFQATQAWDSLLDQLATLDFRGLRIPYSAFLRTLTHQTATTPFTPPSTNAPIQIMPPAAAVGQTFDGLILLRATDANFPPQEHPNPLLSYALQSSLDMPGASQTRAAARAHQTLTTLLAAAPNILFTYAAETPDGPQRLAPILDALTWPQLDVPPTPSPTLIEIDLIPDDAPLPPLPSTHIRGGARVLQLQAACGFRAFAEVRLNAHELDTISLGFDAAQNGQRLHNALQRFWKRVQTQDTLRSMTPEERRQFLRQCVEEALSHHLDLSNAWDEAYVSLQQQRMTSLLQQWLEIELLRSPFSVGESEKDLQVEVGPLTLDVRFDRIDKLEGKSQAFVLVDYKTGASGHPRQWESERPDDPQLPLYSLLFTEDELKGLAFAKVFAGGMKWLGYQSRPGILPSSRININEVVELPELVAQWRATLTQLAEDFADGNAAVTPKRYPQTCNHCPQRTVCRLDPSSLRIPEEDQEELDV